jgi:formylglycine-generating enzyme required for sulfatase activity
MADIFLSYAREDEVRARLYAEAFSSLGWSVFWDPRILPGTSWDDVIEEQLRKCKCVVVLWSEVSVKKRWVRNEASVGDERGVLVPVSLDAAQIPLAFRHRQSAQLQRWAGDLTEVPFRDLLEGIGRHVPKAKRASGSAIGASEPPVQSAPKSGSTPKPGETAHDEFDRLVASIGEIVPLPVREREAPPAADPTPASPGARPSGHRDDPPPLAPNRNVSRDASGSGTGGSEAILVSVSDPSTATTPSRADGDGRATAKTQPWNLIANHVRSITLGIALLAMAVTVTLWLWSRERITEVPRTGPRTTVVEPPATSPKETQAPPAIAPKERQVARERSSGGPEAASGRGTPNAPSEIPDFVEIPAGTFTMGSDKAKDPQADSDELPQHQVALPAFFIARYEITVGQYKTCAGDGGCRPGDAAALEGPDDFPVANVTWDEAIAYCAWLERKLKSSVVKPDRLADVLAGRREGGAWHVTPPSEAEWEKAARGTDGRIYPWGDRIDPAKANYDGAKRGGRTAVGSFPTGASPYGILDMAGNVWEWTRSHYKPYPYRRDDGRDDLKASDDIGRVVRGGSFGHAGRGVRAAYRDRNGPSAAATSGFVWWYPHFER